MGTGRGYESGCYAYLAVVAAPPAPAEAGLGDVAEAYFVDDRSQGSFSLFRQSSARWGLLLVRAMS
jgi:hypothetical protein